MAELHEALKYLGPTKWSDVPTEGQALEAYLADLLEHTQLILDSVPIPTPDDAPLPPRAQAHSNATKAAEVSLSSERPPTPPFGHEKFQKEWGKPLKIKAQENALGLSVYKMSSKDSKGSWFARRSVHEGIGFGKFKRSLQMEFEKSLAEPGPPGTGNVRGVGGEERLEQIKTDKAKVEVFRLSAQFPGPTAARDFVTLLTTSDKALRVDHDAKQHQPPRHWIMVSKPCDHPETQPRTGFVRGFYESIEFIREVPRKLKTVHSSIDLGSTAQSSDHHASVGRNRAATVGQSPLNISSLPDPAEDEDNPVEWIMITRSDPGGGIPRFLVERGTPSSICGDAVKFMDWACQNPHDETPPITDFSRPNELQRRQSHQSWRGRGLAGIEEPEGDVTTEESPVAQPTNRSGQVASAAAVENAETSQPNGISGAVAVAAATLQSYTPQVILDHLPTVAGLQDSARASDEGVPGEMRPTINTQADSRSFMSSTSFASAEDHLTSSSDDEEEKSSIESTRSANGQPTSLHRVHRGKELRRLDEKKLALQEKFAVTRSKLDEAKSRQVDMDTLQESKATEKHEKEIKKHEEKYKKELLKIEKKQDRERQKAMDRKKKLQDKDEKARLTRERDEARQQLEVAKRQTDSLMQIVQDLQKENTALVMKLGRAGLSPIIKPSEGGLRSRGSSLSKRDKKEVKEKDVLLKSGAVSTKSVEQIRTGNS